MDAGGLAQMTYNGFPSNGLGVPGTGFAARNRNANHSKRLSVNLPQKINPISEHLADANPTPRTSRSHLLAGLRTAPKTPGAPASAPYHQSEHYAQAGNGYAAYMQMPQTANETSFGNKYGRQQMFSLPEQVLAPPTIYGQDSEMDPSVLAELQMTSIYLAQRQQQLQAQLASITAAAGGYQGINQNVAFNQGQMTPVSPQNGFYGQQQQAQGPIEVPGQPGLYLVYNPMTGQYQYAVDNSATLQQTPSTANRHSMYAGMMETPSKIEQQTPTFRAEISPPPSERPTPITSRSITPPKKSPSPPSPLAHVEPLPPPSANAFRRGHKKASSLAINPMSGTASGPKTASLATFGSARAAVPAAPLTGTFGPGAARAGEHPVRQPRNPPALEELVALPTSKHEGSKNFAARQRRAALNNLMRAGSVRRAVSGSPRGSPISERDFQFGDDEPTFRKQSPIGSERSAKRTSGDSLEGLGAGGAVHTPASEKGDAFDMASFVKQLPSPIVQGQERKKMMLGVLTAAEKRKSSMF